MENLDFLKNKLHTACISVKKLNTSFSKYFRVNACLAFATALETVSTDQDKDPTPFILRGIENLEKCLEVYEHCEKESDKSVHELYTLKGKSHTKALFEQAWTCYSEDTFQRTAMP